MNDSVSVLSHPHLDPPPLAESILRLDTPKLREVVGDVSRGCTNTADCTASCKQSCACFTVLCGSEG